MKRLIGRVAIVAGLAAFGSPLGCGGGGASEFKSGPGSGSDLSSGNNGAPGAGGSTLGSGSGSGIVGADGGAGIQAIVRDFRFYNVNDPTTVPDFENPPYKVATNGNAEPAGQVYEGPWDDPNIVTETLGSDGKPVYANPSGTTLSTHGKASFDAWYNDVKGTNFDVTVPLALTQDSTTGAFTYDSSVSGIPYDVSGQATNSLGFFPIDDSTRYATPFGDQMPTNAQPAYVGAEHNYSFTVEIDTLFTYAGGEMFQFTGDDDVFVYINGKRVINLGGIHGPESAQVSVDTLGLMVGSSYPLNFFSAERHVTGSNIRFTTTLHLQAAAPPPK